ncbi:hypothetical protein FJQ98_16515 [Lysinibacillus agricola]|uniref:Uncharacterized protein n=1 Tax=Lysinibacillus agricola TaxID=2590012 RepID=A0ABX7ARI2_9BACI|nr:MULTISPECIES: hypothetical protein [Lysinibacillus]KOS61468.1 hypothetical protein AN161_17915 [Lysinibacillus sp. FJAT-14222]QQP10849.1 hypothetical protein FJQ98_16515 [Lysinibacillus agricola]
MAKLTNVQLEKIQKNFEVDGDILVINHEESQYVGDIYKIKLKPNSLIDTEHHPINLSKHCIEMIKQIVGDGISFNNTNTTFWIQ